MLKRTLIAASALLAATPALAATDGTLGATSTGTVNATITLQAPPQGQARVSGLTDLDFGTQQTGAPLVLTRSTNVCLFATTPQGASVTISQPSGTGFRMASGANTIPLTLTLQLNVSGGPPRVDVTNNVPLFLNVNSVSQTCATGGSFLLEATATTSNTTPAGNYSGAITLVIAPS